MERQHIAGLEMGRDFDQIRLTVAARESPGEAWLPAEALGKALLAGGGKELYTAYSAPLKLYER